LFNNDVSGKMWNAFYSCHEVQISKTWDLNATVPLTLSGNFNTEISLSIKSPTFYPGYLALRNEQTGST